MLENQSCTIQQNSHKYFNKFMPEILNLYTKIKDKTVKYK